ncbi:type I restriction-modification system subunit M N-terminal domain-containing protein, partial [Burkholderia gladioli]|uniref:type I restriction-modification system subunit M N-terminal domain-containing protein n=1 Tax=Burkholderia gladioli TaxID=28095 RepID=UPI001C26F870
MNHQALSSFIWSVADLLRGDYKQSEYGRVDSRPKVTRLQQVFSSKIDPHVRMPAWDAKQENRSDYGEHVG